MKTITEIIKDEMLKVCVGNNGELNVDQITITSDLGKKIVSNCAFIYADQFKANNIAFAKFVAKDYQILSNGKWYYIRDDREEKGIPINITSEELYLLFLAHTGAHAGN